MCFCREELSSDTHSYLRAFSADQQAAALKEYFDILASFLRRTLCSLVREVRGRAPLERRDPKKLVWIICLAQGHRS